MTILIKNVLLDKEIKDIYIQGNTIKAIDNEIHLDADHIIDGKNKAVIPGLFNGHTHAAMTLMRGYADDMHLMPWLEEKIWPLESKITEDDVYWGAKLAILEMIKTGTTCFIDMYHQFPGTLRAIEEMGLRGLITQAVFDFDQPQMAEKYKKLITDFHEKSQHFPDRIKFALGPHAIYTVSTDLLKWISTYAIDNNLKIQIHLSETENEVNDSIEKFGKRPVQYLHSIGFLNNNVSLAHCVHLDDTDIKTLAKTGAQVVHNPASNLKLASGNQFRYTELKKAGIPICIGTDGTSSSNNLDMLEAIKIASLNGKAVSKDPTIWTAEETLKAATESAEQITGFKIGKIEVGYLADINLIRLNVPEMIPNFNLASNLVYSANGSVVDTVICDGKILMQNRLVEGEEEIMENANRVAFDLTKRINSSK